VSLHLLRASGKVLSSKESVATTLRAITPDTLTVDDARATDRLVIQAR
jgi:hypothetical protein